MQKLNVLHTDAVVMVLNHAENAVIQKALFELRTKLNNQHADIVAVLQSDVLSESEFDLKNQLLTMIEDELNAIAEITEIQF